jgi:predicted CXXCH cytochrome family protein
MWKVLRWAHFVWACFIIVVAVLGLGALYVLLVPGLSSARTEAPAAEVKVATWLLHQSVPSAMLSAVNPFGDDPADVTAGRNLYREKCEICHGYDGSGKTTLGAGQYPRPPALASDAVQAMPDGEVFYHIRNGIRNTAMPAWGLPDREIWQLVSYIRDLPKVAQMTPSVASARQDKPQGQGGGYVGSAACKSCHEKTYTRWSRTRMANVVVDPKQHPEAIVADFSKADSLLTLARDDFKPGAPAFTRENIALVYGSRWKQRYFTKIGDDYFVYPVQWDVAHQQWRRYFVANGTDWWAAHYPPDNFQRPTGPLCDGCHSVNYDIATKTVTEWNVGCEKCHGPGEAHVSRPARDNILNAARFDYVHANDVCIQCHSQGQPLTNPIAGKHYDWPVGFDVGKNLADYWKLEEHKLGETTFTHFADGAAHKNRMQGNDFVDSLMYARGVTCFSCHDPHGSENVGMVRKTGNALCLDCHGPNTQAGPHAATIEQHTHHKAGSPGSECVACHMPKIAQTIADQNVRSHTFHFVTPGDTETLKIPNACTVCHTDKSTDWAAVALRSWPDRSPWRMSR